MKVRYRELALSDLDHIFRYLDQHSPAGARKMIDAVHAAIDHIAKSPSGRAAGLARTIQGFDHE